MTTSVRNNSVFRSFFEKQKLTRPNFIDWYRQLCLVPSTEDKENYLEHHIPAAPVPPPGQQVPPQALAAHAAWVKGQKKVVVLMLLTMDLEIQRNLAHLGKMGYASNNALFAPKPRLLYHQRKITLQRTPFATNVVKFGHSRRNCPMYLAELMKNKKLSQGASSLDGTYSHQVERAKDLLGLIHTDVCGSFKIVSRQGASYFVTFTDDFSRYGYVYLMKHKHEVFKTFNVFQKEVENQLGKTIKSLRSDRGGEYMSQEFFDHLKEHEIIAHRTPPYTPQYNGVSERRNRTLVDMVRSMLSQTTLPNPFWDYAHETAAQHAKGFTQTNGVDYEETFSPVADIRAIRILIAIATYYDYEIWQMDVKTAFLNGHLFEEVYMEKLKASRSYIAILILYADDILLMGNNISMLQDVKPYLGRSFALKDLVEAAYILEIKIYRDRLKRLIGLCQKAYIEKILKRYYMKNSKRGTIPMQEKLKLSKSKGASTPAEKQRMQNIPYTLAVGSIMYAVRYVEYIATFDASKEAVWIRRFISGIGIVPIIEEPISMYCDNTEAITIAKYDGVTKGARHFRTKVHCLRETIKLGDVKIEKIDTDDNLVDPFTKALAFPKYSELTRNIELLPARSFM
nr:retrotransposon protein, putative, Ty1-copia subclass [Tanacetum cinerariifolium]